MTAREGVHIGLTSLLSAAGVGNVDDIVKRCPTVIIMRLFIRAAGSGAPAGRGPAAHRTAVSAESPLVTPRLPLPAVTELP